MQSELGSLRRLVLVLFPYVLCAGGFSDVVRAVVLFVS